MRLGKILRRKFGGTVANTVDRLDLTHGFIQINQKIHNRHLSEDQLSAVLLLLFYHEDTKK